jgi:hypothetical protein
MNIKIPVVIEDAEEFTCQDCEYYDSYNGLCKKTKEEKHFLDSVCKNFKFVPF